MTVPNLTPAAWAADAPAGSKLLPPKKRLLSKLDLIEMGISLCNTIIKDNELDLIKYNKFRKLKKGQKETWFANLW